MSHPAQIKFLKKVKKLYPQYFKNVMVADIGSMDINGSCRGMFENSLYTGIDICEGKNVDVVEKAHLYLQRRKQSYDVVISCECLEHDVDWDWTLNAMYAALKDGGLLVITAAGDGREEHGTSNFHPTLSPATNDYYRNVFHL